MKAWVIRLVDGLLRLTCLQFWPVRVRAGIAAGARWTLYPCSAYWRGTHEPSLQQALRDLGDIQGWSCWDLGAHYGIYSVGLARRAGAKGEVAAFEPNPISYARLERHRRMNGLSTLKTFSAALSDRNGAADLLTYGDLRSTTTHLAYEHETLGATTQPIRVQTLVLDDLVASGQLRPPQLIKVDVEGHAHRALAGAARTLVEHRPVLIVAFHSTEEVNGVLALLTPLGYSHAMIPTESGSTDPMIGHDLIFTPVSRR